MELVREVQYEVAPVRERGLKLLYWCQKCLVWRRSREGAWIETLHPKILKLAIVGVAPVRERGLKLAW